METITGKEEALKQIDQLAKEFGITVMVFRSKEEMRELFEDMRLGARVKESYKELQIELPKEYLM